MVAIRKAFMVSLIMSVAACGDDDRIDQTDLPDQVGRLNPAADQKVGIYWPTAVDTKAELVYSRPPPSDVVDLNFDGITVIQLVVGTNGIVDTAFVERASGRDSVDSLMLDVARKMVWTPAVHDGAPVKMRTSFPFIFRKSLPSTNEGPVTKK